MNSRCPTCGGRYVTWTPVKIIEACQEWARRHDGVPPAAKDWNRSAPWHPSPTAVYRHFGSWNRMIAAAGFKPRVQGGQSRCTREYAEAALFEWRFTHGRLPTMREWRLPAEGRPTCHQAVRLFGSWNAFLVACGYGPVKKYRSVHGYRSQAAAVTKRKALVSA